MVSFRQLSFALVSALALSVSAPVVSPVQAATITNSDIARFKAALKLTGAQARMWPAVAAALRAYSREERSVADLLPVVAPFYHALSSNQQRIAKSLAQQIGLGSYAMLM